MLRFDIAPVDSNAYRFVATTSFAIAASRPINGLPFSSRLAASFADLSHRTNVFPTNSLKG